LALSSPTAAATSLERTVVFAHRGSVSVVDATYLGSVFNATAKGFLCEQLAWTRAQDASGPRSTEQQRGFSAE
jgi:hypothetical protein